MSKEIKQYLIERAYEGDREAFGEIYHLLKDSIYGFSYRMTNRALISEEITQETFMFFIENPDKYRPEKGTLFSFLCGVARNKILNHLKKSGTRLESNEFETERFENFANQNGTSPLRDVLNKEFSVELKKSIGKLSAFQREVLLLREMEELSYAEIAQITKTDVGVVKGRLHRARKTLANELAPYFKSEKEDTYEVH